MLATIYPTAASNAAHTRIRPIREMWEWPNALRRAAVFSLPNQPSDLGRRQLQLPVRRPASKRGP